MRTPTSSPSSAMMRVILLAAVASVASAQNSGLKPLVSKGCYSSAGDLTNIGSYQFQTPGYCQQQCVNSGKAVMATSNGSDCYCGDQIPADSDQTSSSNCNVKCNGYGQLNCTSTCGSIMHIVANNVFRWWIKHLFSTTDRYKFQSWNQLWLRLGRRIGIQFERKSTVCSARFTTVISTSCRPFHNKSVRAFRCHTC